MIIEAAFGKLKGRWRILLRKCESKTYAVKMVALAAIVLHNLCVELNGVGTEGGGGGVTTCIFLIRRYPVKTKGEPKAGAGFLTNHQPKSGANHISYKNATQSRGVAEWRSLEFIVYFIGTNLLVFY